MQIKQFLRLDHAISHKIHLFFSQITLAKVFFQLLSITNHGMVWILLGPSLIWISWLCELWGNQDSLMAIESHRLQFLAFCFAVDLMVVGLAKIILKRARPSYGKKAKSNSSFPSGHSSRAAILLFLWVNDYYGSETFWSLKSLVVVGWCALMGLARVSLAAHFLSDVTMGYIIGVFEAFTLASVVRTNMGLFSHNLKWSEWWEAARQSDSLHQFVLAFLGNPKHLSFLSGNIRNETLIA
mmetsp:Transcript_3157/g.12083  ORF Transcript_3157/g.12083 Transcript_3157/m.12083 type:complete len:240 (-) Transcript_3157:1878-2597(-)